MAENAQHISKCLIYLMLQIKMDGITKLVVLPLYPQFSISTSGSSLRLLESIFRLNPKYGFIIHA